MNGSHDLRDTKDEHEVEEEFYKAGAAIFGHGSESIDRSGLAGRRWSDMDMAQLHAPIPWLFMGHVLAGPSLGP